MVLATLSGFGHHPKSIEHCPRMDSTRRNKSFSCVFNTTGAREMFSHTHGAERAHNNAAAAKVGLLRTARKEICR